MKALILGVVILAAAPFASSAPGQWAAGQHYTVLGTPQPLSPRKGEVEVIEAFSYKCGFCFRFDPYLTAWIARKPGYVHVTRMPTVWNDEGRALARLHYTLEALNRRDVQAAVLETVSHDHKALRGGNETDTYQRQLKFVESHGVNARDFAAAYHSRAVDEGVARSERIGELYRIELTPTLIVNGRYTINLRQTQIKPDPQQRGVDYQSILSVLDELTAAEHGPASAAVSHAKPPRGSEVLAHRE